MSVDGDKTDKNHAMNQTMNAELVSEIDELLRQRNDLAAEGKYVESNSIKEQINKLKDLNILQNVKDFKIKHLNESKLLEENYNNEIAAFNEEWNKKLNDFNTNSKKVEEMLIERHKSEVEALTKSIDDQFNKTLKMSSTYLKYKDSERRLIKLEEFLEANIMKKKALALEKEELAENQRRKDRSLKMRSPALLNKQALEKDNFKKKIQLELEIFEKEKLKNFEEFKNRRLELEMNQRQEKSSYFNSSFLKKRFAAIDHKHINAGNVSMQIFPNESPKKLMNGFSSKFKNILPKTENTIRLDTDGQAIETEEGGDKVETLSDIEKREGTEGDNENKDEDGDDKPKDEDGDDKPKDEDEDEKPKDEDEDEKPKDEDEDEKPKDEDEDEDA